MAADPTPVEFQDVSRFFYDKEGKNISIVDAEAHLNDTEYVVVGRCDIGPCWIATDWMPVHIGVPDHLFETIVVTSGKNIETDVDVWGRYMTEQEAIEGHAEAVAHCLDHEHRCCTRHRLHTNPHKGCVLR